MCGIAVDSLAWEYVLGGKFLVSQASMVACSVVALAGPFFVAGEGFGYKTSLVLKSL